MRAGSEVDSLAACEALCNATSSCAAFGFGVKGRWRGA